MHIMLEIILYILPPLTPLPELDPIFYLKPLQSSKIQIFFWYNKTHKKRILLKINTFINTLRILSLIQRASYRKSFGELLGGRVHD